MLVEKKRHKFRTRHLSVLPTTHSHVKIMGLSPYSSDEQKVFYEDLLNSLFNKGALTNDPEDYLILKRKTINIPIDLDKFVNGQCIIG